MKGGAKMETKSIGKFIATLRKEKAYTQSELAEKLGVSNKTISNWENEVSYPDLTLIPVIADLFNITADELLRGSRKEEQKVYNKENDKYDAVNKIKHNLEKNLMNRYSNYVYISIAIFICAFIFIVLGFKLLEKNNGIYIENEKIFGTILSIIGILFYITGLFFSIINSKNFLNKLDIEEDNASLYLFHLRKTLLLECLYSFLILSPLFIYLHDKKLLYDNKYKASESVKGKIEYNNKLKIKLGKIFSILSLVICILIFVANLLSIEQFEFKKFDDSILEEEGKYEVKVEGDTFTFKSLSELYSITVQSIEVKDGLIPENKVYEFNAFFESEKELRQFAIDKNYHYSLECFEIEIVEDFDRMLIKYDSDIILVLYSNEYKGHIIYTNDKLDLVDVGNNQFKNITSDTHYVRDIAFSFLYITLVIEIVVGFAIYFLKKKYIKYNIKLFKEV